MSNNKPIVLNKGARPLLLAKSKRDPGKNADGSTANDMKYGDYSKEQIKNIRFMFGIDDAIQDLDKVKADILFAELEHMATTLFSAGKLEGNIKRMINKFKSNSGGTYSDSFLTEAVRYHQNTIRLENEVRSKLSAAVKKHKGNIYNIKPNLDIIITSHVAFHTKSDIFKGLTIAINDTWAYKVEIVEYSCTDKDFKGTFKITLYDHFGLDEPDVDNSKSYGYLVGFRAWFILQHLDRFAHKPFLTVVELPYTFKGVLN